MGHYFHSTMFVFLAFSILDSVICGRAYSQSADKDQKKIDRWPPQRITAADHPPSVYQGNLPRQVFPNLPRDYGFWGQNLKYKPEETDVNLESPGCAVCYPCMEMYTLFPAMGELYCFDKIEKNHFSASRLNDDEIPKGVTVGKYTYIFPSSTPILKSFCVSGRLAYMDKGTIIVGPIERDEKQKEPQYTAKIVVSEWLSFNQEDKKNKWQVVRVNDEVDFGRHKCLRVVNIVPPDTKGQMIRGHLCKMIGWIEFDRTPITAQPKKKKEAAGRQSGEH
jgi:hypothetical protein